MKKVTRYSRILALICTMALLALTVAGCGQKTGSDKTNASNVEEAEKSEENKEAKAEEKAEEEPAQESQAQAESATSSSGSETLNAEGIDAGDLGGALAAAPGSGNLPKDEFDKEYVGSSGDDKAQGSALASANAADFEGDYYFDTDESFLILADGDTTQVYTGGVMEGANFSVEKVELSESIGDTIVNRTKEVADMLSVRMIGQPDVQGIEIGDRRLAGFVTTYSAVDGTKTIVAEEFYEEIDGTTYCWYAIYDKGDEVAPEAFKKAMQTFTLK